MTDIVNLNRYRKARRRTEQAEVAAQNRVRYGRTGSERAAQAKTQAQDRRALDGKRIDTPPPKDEEPGESR